MIHSLRQKHRRWFVILGFSLPIAFAAGIGGRKSLPVMVTLPAALAPVSFNYQFQQWERDGLFPRTGVQVQLWRQHKGFGTFAFGFVAPKNFIKPDLLVYWVGAGTAVTDILPADSYLLGAFGTAVLPIRAEFTKTNGSIVLYSLADNEIVAVSVPIEFNDLVK